MPKQVLRTLAVIFGAVASNATVAANLIPMSPATKAGVMLGSNAVLAALAHWNLYKNPDASSASVAYQPEMKGTSDVDGTSK